MPSSRPNTIPIAIHLLRQLRPQSILDVGVGFGKWGHLFREYTDILEAEQDPPRYHRENWQVRIDGIEGHAAYLTDMHRYLYNEIHVGEAGLLMKSLSNYDLIFLGDVIEHLEKGPGEELLGDACARANKAVVVSTPKFETAQGDLCGNELERHRSLWTEADFARWPNSQVTVVDDATLLAVLRSPGVTGLKLTPLRQPKPADVLRLQRTLASILALGFLDTPYILVDEDLFRQALGSVNARPFLEKTGQYWGPPPDDDTAILELQRMMSQGARFIVFLWTTFWWLDHYERFYQHLRSNFACVRTDENLVVFRLK